MDGGDSQPDQWAPRWSPAVPPVPPGGWHPPPARRRGGGGGRRAIGTLLVLALSAGAVYLVWALRPDGVGRSKPVPVEETCTEGQARLEAAIKTFQHVSATSTPTQRELIATHYLAKAT